MEKQISNESLSGWRVLSFCLIIFQSIGIRFFEGQGILLSGIILILNIRYIVLIKKRDVAFLFFIFLFLFINKLLNNSFTYSKLFFQVTIFYSTYLFLLQYRNCYEKLEREFFQALKLFVFHAIIGYFFYLLLSKYFYNINIMNLTFFNIFFVSSSDFMGIQRNSGIFWEPGVFQIIANLYLFFCIYYKKTNFQIFIGIIAVLSSFSTTGLLILCLNLLFYTFYKTKGLLIFKAFIIFIGITFFVPIILNNAQDKMNGENTSGLARVRDFQIGIDFIKEKPILGHGIYDSEYIKSKRIVNSTESNLFSAEYIEISGVLGGGFTNGLLGFIVYFGIPFSFLFYFYFFKNRFISESIIVRILFCTIILFSMFTEPIGSTSLFLMFPLSYWILKNIPNTKTLNK